MKHRLRLLPLLLWSCLLVACHDDGQAQPAIGLVWSPTTTVAANTFDNMKPQIALLGDGAPVVTWGSAIGARKGWVSTWDGTAFTAPVQLNPSGTINAYTVEGPNVVASGDTIVAVYCTASPTTPSVRLRTSTDRGATWSLPMLVDSLTGGDMPTFSNLALAAGGEVVVTYIRQTATYADPRYVVRRSADLGLTWTPEVVASDSAPGSDVCDCCTSQPYAHDGKVILAFRNNDGNLRDMWAVVSDDGGQTFPTAIDLDSTDWQLAACPSSGPASLFRGDSIYTVFMSQGGNGLARVWIGASSLATGQLAYNRMLLDTLPAITQNYPTIAGNGDTVVVAWYQNNGTNPEIALRYSFTGVAGLFDNPVQYVNNFTAGVQTNPDMVWRAGKLHLVWQDDASNTVKYRSATVGELVGTAEPQASLRAYPNPSTGVFRLPAVQGATWLGLVDAGGRRLDVAPLWEGGLLTLDLAGLPAGCYTALLRDAAGLLHAARLQLIQP